MEHDSEEVATIEEVAMENADPPVAKTVLCNRCNIPIFGDNWVAPTVCCADLFCKYCWDSILRDGDRCTQFGCENTLLKKAVMYLTEDFTDLASKEREVSRQMKLNADPGFQRLQEDINNVKTQTERQEEQIAELTRMNVLLEDQIMQSTGRLEAVRNETYQLIASTSKANEQAAAVVESNESLIAKIQTVQAQIQALNRMAAKTNRTSVN